MSDQENGSTDESSDWAEFASKSYEYNDSRKFGQTPLKEQPIPTSSENKEKPVGTPTQYALHGDGFTATTSTVPSLPAGCYDINVDTHCVFATPALKQSGILLELPEMRSEEVIKIVDTFWDSEKDYKEGNEFVVGGAAYKAGIMVYGPPGSGKSCTLKLVSNKLVARGGIVFYASGHPSNAMVFLSDFAKIEENRKCIVILEDFDSLIQNWGESQYLEMLDSAKSINNVLFIATTNYPERLDPRIYNRPGRFSHVVKIGLPGPKTREAYLKAILKNHRDISEIVEKSQGFTIDHLTALVNAVYREKKDLQKELKRLRILFNPPQVDNKGMGFAALQEDANE
jgi:Cdc6-like AAA superfamily ATPase